MALTGNIEVFPLPEVLRLLARSGKDGCLRVDAVGVDGRIYMQHGALTHVTVASDSEFLDQVASSGIVDRDRVQGFDAVDLPAALVPGASPEELSDFVREHMVEALYRIRRPGAGSFEFLVDAESRFRTGQSFDTEQAVAEADRRAAEWADIEQTISDMFLPVRMVPELSEPEVSVNAPTWRVLASLEGGSSIAEIARHLGTTEFRAAREVASLIRSSLIEPVVTAQPAEIPSAGSWYSGPPPVAPQPTEAQPVPEPDVAASPWATADTQETQQPQEAPAVDPWSQPVSETDPAPVSADEPADVPETHEETAEESGARGGWWADAMQTTDEVGDVDTDRFLESVFADAGSDQSDDEEESGFSMGLLRRRRMGPMTRDLSDSD